MHGPPTILRKNAHEVNPNSLEARLINFTFSFAQQSQGPEEDTTLIVKTQKVPRSWDVYRVKAVVGRLFGVKPLGTRLVWETDEWDPVAEGDDEDQDEDQADDKKWDAEGARVNEAAPATACAAIGTLTADAVTAAALPKEKWIRREEELTDGTREVGFWVDGREARVRVELR